MSRVIFGYFIVGRQGLENVPERAALDSGLGSQVEPTIEISLAY
jgi:hypothetical protein